MSERKTWLERFMAGSALVADLDDEVGAWHDNPDTGIGLHEWLGLTWEEYQVFAVSPEAFERQMLEARVIVDQKKASPDQKGPSLLTAEQRRRMREAAEAAALEAPGEWRTGDKGAAELWYGFHDVTCDATGEDAGMVDRAVVLQANPYFHVEPISRHVVETQPSAVLALLGALEQAERERDALRDRLAAAERRNAAWNAHLEALRSDRMEESEQE
jgi:hypothetical protein